MEGSLAFETLAFLAAVALVAGFIDTLAGGGGLIALPALLMGGVPPLVALGTNKLQGSVGTAMASWMMFTNGRAEWTDVRWLMLAAFVGSCGGSIAVQFVDPGVLSLMIPVVLGGIALYFLLAPQPAAGRVVSHRSLFVFRRLAVPVLGWYDGMFGPGTGSFFAFAGVTLRGQGLVDATAVAKTLNFATNVASLFVFVGLGRVYWKAGAVMILGQLVGAWLGSHCLIRINVKALRGLVVVMCLAMLVRYGRSQAWW